MSLELQEQVLLRLLFERPFRERFAADPKATLAPLDLTDAERTDFFGIDVEGLALDADNRADMVIGRMVASFPMSASMLSALPKGLDLIRGALHVEHFMRPALERPIAFVTALEEGIRRGEVLCSPPVREFLLNVLGWEKALAIAAASVRAFDSGLPVEASTPDARTVQDAQTEPPAWMELGLGLAPNLIVYQLPAALETLRTALLPALPSQLWARLLQAPMPKQRLEDLVSGAKAERVIFARTRLVSRSRCEADASHDVLEAPSGFIPIAQALDGKRTGREIMDQLGAVGAPERIVVAVKRCVGQLIQARMIVARS